MKTENTGYILGIETSCDETAGAVYSLSDEKIISNKLFSQIDLHKIYGGVVPEIASRSHLEKIDLIIQENIEAAGITLDQISAIAVTSKPGLAGSLLVGFSFAKALAWSLNIPFIPVDHLEGHIFSAFLDSSGNKREDIPFPLITCSVSGGHSSLYQVNNFGEYTHIGNTLDDAAGEAFDKIAKLIGLGYPGGPIIEKLAESANFQDFYKYPRTKNKPKNYNFSFSGLKTAVMYDLVKRGYYSLESGLIKEKITKEIQTKVASSLLVCIADIFLKMLDKVFTDFPDITGATFVGGVSCNKYIIRKLEELCDKKNKFFAYSPRQFSTDNGAMIALVGSYKYKNKLFGSLSSDIFE